MLSLLADESLSHRIVRRLRRVAASLDLLNASGVGWVGWKDPDLLAWVAANGRILVAFATYRYARIAFTTFPATSVRRKSRPAFRKVRRLWSRPNKWRIVACRSCMCTLSSTARKPYSSVAPWTQPPFTPPPASHIVNPSGL